MKKKDIAEKEKGISCRKEKSWRGPMTSPAMKVVSENLGHNRISVIAQSYLYN